MTNKKIAIIFYGLTRSLKKTIKSFETYLFKELSENSIDYDIFIHTYKIVGPYHNMWSSEHTNKYNNEDIENILKPKYLLYDDQNNVINNINFDEYYTKLGNWEGMGTTDEMTKYLIRNMCLGLYSKNKITSLFEEKKHNYDYAIIIRPDIALRTKIDINWFTELNNNNIIIPNMNWFHGCNDQICIGKVDTILYYGTLFDSLKKYSTEKSIVSERFMLDMLEKKQINILGKEINYDTIRM